jgi:DNA polymerase III subunit epsilon
MKPWVVVDVETSGTDPDRCRIVSIAALALADDCTVETSLVSLIDPGIDDPGPTSIHGLTAQMLAGQPRFHDVAAQLVTLLRGRVLVAHNVGFDYAFLAAEARKTGVVLPVDSVMCTVELATRLDLGVDNLKLATLARHFGVPQSRPHDALDDATVLARILACTVTRARALDVLLPVRHPSTLSPPSFRLAPAA